jgi:hypothetical protein
MLRGKFVLAAIPVVLLLGCGNSGGGTVSTGFGFSSQPPAPTTVVSTPAPVPTAEASAPVTSAAPTEDPTVAALSAWTHGGGIDKLDAITTALGQLAAGGSDPTAVRAACIQLTVAVSAAKVFKPIPEADVQQHWAAALSDLSSASVDCVAGIDSSNNDTIRKSASEINDGTAEISQAKQTLLSAMP